MFSKRAVKLILFALVISSILVTISCAPRPVIKNTLVKEPRPGLKQKCDQIKDWKRIAGMTNEEIAKALGIPMVKEVVKEVPKEVIKEVPKEVVKEVVKEVPQEKVVVREKFILSNVLFDFDKAIVRPEGQVVLKQIAEILKNKNYPPVEVAGHTCSIGSEKYNEKLGLKRAEAVKAYLVKLGVPADTIETISYGETRPIADNKTKIGRMTNRRVEIEIKE